MTEADRDEVSPTAATEVRGRAPTTPPSHASTVGSPLDALDRDEVLRTRRFCYIALAIAGVGAIATVLLPGDPTAAGLLLSGVVIAVGAVIFLLRRTRDLVRFRLPSTSLGWFIPAACVTLAIPYFGVFSPAPLVLVLGIYFTGLSRNAEVAVVVYGVCAGAQLLIAALVISQTIPDPGVVQIKPLATFDQVVIQALTQFVLLATFATARMSRRTALMAVGELERAVRVAAHREALLLEAREELERALRAGRGRFTGQQLVGYQLGTVIGRGAMGEVYEAIDNAGNRVAIKLLSPAAHDKPQHIMRFFRELRTAIGIESPHVVRVLAVGEEPVPFLVMERLEGHTLAELLKAKRTLTTNELCELLAEVGIGISAAAAAGVIHRDLKPQNLFRHHTQWKILDFGVARAAFLANDESLTGGHIVGTPSYMAPEQATGGTVDHRSDLYSIAAVAYRCVTGQPPYIAGEIAETLYRVVHTRPPRPGELAPHLPYDLDLALAIGLAARQSDRFSTAHELAGAVAEALDGRLSRQWRERGDALVRDGAWAAPDPRRASTNRIRL